MMIFNYIILNYNRNQTKIDQSGWFVHPQPAPPFDKHNQQGDWWDWGQAAEEVLKLMKKVEMT